MSSNPWGPRVILCKIKQIMSTIKYNVQRRLPACPTKTSVAIGVMQGETRLRFD